MKPSEAAPYFAHPTQARYAPDGMPDWMEYRAKDGVCLVFHGQFWPGIWQCHIGVMPWAWGRVDGPAADLLRQFAAEKDADRIVAWIDERNRAAIALARRIGFETDGQMPGIVMLGWSRQWHS